MHLCSNSEKYSVNCLPKHPFCLKEFLTSFVEVFGPKQTAEADHNLYNDFRYWAQKNEKPSFALQGRRGSRFSWMSKNARFLLLNREMILEFGDLSQRPGNKHEHNHRLTNILARMRSHWGYIFTFLGGFTILWTYIIKHFFSKFSKMIALGELNSVKRLLNYFNSETFLLNHNLEANRRVHKDTEGYTRVT